MDTLHIQRLEARYHLPRRQLDMRQRLDKLLADIVPQALETALEFSGVSPHEEICLRQLHVPVRLRLSASDPVLIGGWCEALAEAIRTLIDSGQSALVVRYSSRINALADFALGVANRQYPRAWAWNQLGLAQLSSDTTDSEALAQFMAAILAHPQAILPVLRILAQQNRLQILAPRLDQEAWHHLALAALTAAGGQPARVMAYRSRPDHSQRKAKTHDGRRFPVVSSLADHVIRLPSHFTEPRVPRHALTILIALEAQPELVRANDETLVTRLQAIDAALAAALSDAGAGQAKSLPDATQSRASSPHPSENGTKNLPSGRHASESTPDSASQVNRNTRVDIDHLASVKHSVIHMSASRTLPQELSPAPDPVTASQTDYPRPDTLELAGTAYGGLLYLLPLFEGLGLVETLPTDPRFKQRSLRWILHALALRLTGCGERDPAALAFCGQSPLAAPPGKNESPVDAEETRALDAAIERLTGSLTQRIGGDRLPMDRLIDFVCRRRARIQADPGWIECVLSMEEVSTVIRRAGLDLDPGYLPWLGVVVVFRYE